MGIFKEQLPQFVRDQISIRQKTLSSGNNKPGRSNNFFTYSVNKQCQMRMASMVDLVESDILDLDSKSTKGTIIEKDLLGSGLAATYVLDGGTIMKPFKKGEAVDGIQQTNVSAFNIKRKGFSKLGASYGDPIIRGDAKDGYGIVPMPGIIDMNIRTKSAYGSLREAKVNFVCHNLRQLEILELLYMRPGYPILLEWDWSPYIDNNGIKQHHSSWLSDKQNFWQAGWSQTKIHKSIIEKKKESNANYDGILGYVKNFSFTARPDGGFDCNTELIAMGEVLDSIKGQMSTSTSGGRTPQLLSMAEQLLYYASDIAVVEEKDEDTGKVTRVMMEDATSETITIWQHLNPVNRIKEISGNPWWQKTFTSVWDKALDNKEEWMDVYDKALLSKMGIKRNMHIFGKNASPFYGFWRDHPSLISLTGGIGLDPFYGNPIEDMETGDFGGCGGEGYIRLDALCALINYQCLDVQQNDSLMKKTPGAVSKVERIVALQTMNYTPSTGKYSPFQFNSYKPKMVKLGAAPYKDRSIDPYSCLLPEQRPGFSDTGWFNETLDWEEILPVRNVYGYIEGDSKEDLEKVDNGMVDTWIVTDASDNTLKYGGETGSAQRMTIEEAEELHFKCIGNIFVNLKMFWSIVNELWQKQVEAGEEATNNFSVGGVIKRLIEQINKSTGDNIKLGLVTHHELPHVINIVDLNSPLDPALSYDDIFKINVQSNDSQVRDFGLSTQMPSALSATIAVAAMNPDNADNIDSVTFNAINRGIRNRLFLQTENPYEKATTKEKATKIKLVNSQIDQWKGMLKLDTDYNAAIASCTYLDDDAFKNRRSGALSNLNKLHSLSDTLLGKYLDNEDPKFGYFMDNPPSGTPIPISLKLNMDGVSGMVIGNLFKIQDSRLPTHYRNNKILFLITEEDQKITSGQDWTTEITGMMQLFPGTNTGKTKICTVDNNDFRGNQIHTIYADDMPADWSPNMTSYPAGTLDNLYYYQCERCMSDDPDSFESYSSWVSEDDEYAGDSDPYNLNIIRPGTTYVYMGGSEGGLGYGGVEESDQISEAGMNWLMYECPQDGYTNPQPNPYCDIVGDLAQAANQEGCEEGEIWNDKLGICESPEDVKARKPDEIAEIQERIDKHKASKTTLVVFEKDGYKVTVTFYADGWKFGPYGEEDSYTAEEVWNIENTSLDYGYFQPESVWNEEKSGKGVTNWEEKLRTQLIHPDGHNVTPSTIHTIGSKQFSWIREGEGWGIDVKLDESKNPIKSYVENYIDKKHNR